jgi:tetratricopeptide (TPR) repeat protein
VKLCDFVKRAFLLATFNWTMTCLASSPSSLFTAGSRAYHEGSYTQAARDFREAAALAPASGTLQNLGNSEWQRGRVGPAVLAWEQAVWLDPFNVSSHTNLRFARKVAQIEAPEMAWYEVVSAWLPVNWWAAIATVSFWLAVALTLVPGIFRQRKATWHQAIAAFGLMVFMLSVPAHIGVHTRSRLGFVLAKDTPLRLTPTSEGQLVTRLAAGEPARLQRVRGKYLLVRANRSLGWIERDQFGLLCQKDLGPL